MLWPLEVIPDDDVPLYALRLRMRNEKMEFAKSEIANLLRHVILRVFL